MHECNNQPVDSKRMLIKTKCVSLSWIPVDSCLSKCLTCKEYWPCDYHCPQQTRPEHARVLLPRMLIPCCSETPEREVNCTGPFRVLSRFLKRCASPCMWHSRAGAKIGASKAAEHSETPRRYLEDHISSPCAVAALQEDRGGRWSSERRTFVAVTNPPARMACRSSLASWTVMHLVVYQYCGGRRCADALRRDLRMIFNLCISLRSAQDFLLSQI